MLKGIRLLSNASCGFTGHSSRMVRSAVSGAVLNDNIMTNSCFFHLLAPTNALSAGACARVTGSISTENSVGLSRAFGAPSLSHRKFFFMKATKPKGRLSYRGERNPRSSWKKANYKTNSMYKLKTCNSLKVRVKIVGPRHDRKFKVIKAGYHHLLRNKSKAARRRANKVKYIHKADLYRVKKMLPYWKHQSFKRAI